MATLQEPSSTAPAYTGAVIDAETGLYYMNARYYESETGRFISQDTYRGKGEGFWHLYLYCGGDPVNCTDPTGHKPGDKFKTPDAAAKDYAYYIYALTGVFRVETGAAIYSYMSSTFTTSYSYNNFTIGEPHSVSMPFSIPNRTRAALVGYVHCHPNSNSFSDKDKSIAISWKIYAYVATPNKKLLKYNPTTKKTTTVARNLSYRKLTPQALHLFRQYTENKWYNHLPCSWHCENKTWPNVDTRYV